MTYITKEYLNQLGAKGFEKRRRRVQDLLPRVTYNVLGFELVQSKFNDSTPIALVQSGDEKPFHVYLP